MKRHYGISLAVISAFLNFFCFWYADSLLNRYFIFGLIPIAIAILLLLVCIIVSIISACRYHFEIVHDIPLIISIVTIVVLFVFPFRTAKVNVELHLYEKDRLEIVEMIKDGEITTDHLGNAKLPKGYGHLSSDGEIFVYENDSEQVISFWVFRGMLSGSVQLIYSSGDESLIYANEKGHPITDVQKLKDHWYLVETDY